MARENQFKQDFFKTFLEEMGFEVILTKEPTADPEVGREVRKILNKEIKLEPREISFFFPKR